MVLTVLAEDEAVLLAAQHDALTDLQPDIDDE